MKYLSKALFLLYLLFLFTVFLPEQRSAVADQAEQDSTGVKLEIKIAKDVVDRVPSDIDTVFNNDVGRIYCWSAVMGVEDSLQIYHIWNYEGEEVSRVPIMILGPYFRAFSFQTIEPDMVGKWTVYIIDSEDNILGLVNFRVSSLPYNN